MADYLFWLGVRSHRLRLVRRALFAFWDRLLYPGVWSVMYAGHTLVPMASIEFIIGSFGLTMGVVLLFVLLRQQLHRKIPFFTFYTGFSTVTVALGLWTMLSSSTSYFSFYWITEVISGILELLALQEAFMPALRMEYKQKPWLRMLPRSVLFLIMFNAELRAIYHPFGRGPFVHLAAGAYTFELGVNLLEVAIFAFSLKLVRREFHPIRQLHRFAIVAGLGFVACASVLPDFVRLSARVSISRNAAALDAVLRHLPPAAYVGVLIIWLVVFLRPLPARSPATPEQIERRSQSQRKIQERLRPKGPAGRFSYNPR